MQESIGKLQLIEENLRSYLAQKQQVQAQLMELESAVEALDGAKSAYRIIGSIMVEQSAGDTKKDLEERMERAKVRLASIEKQEEKAKQQAEKLQQEIMAGMKR